MEEQALHTIVLIGLYYLACSQLYTDGTDEQPHVHLLLPEDVLHGCVYLELGSLDSRKRLSAPACPLSSWGLGRALRTRLHWSLTDKRYRLTHRR
jgi:hypothetical protein